VDETVTCRRGRSLLTIPGWSCGVGVWSRLVAAVGLEGVCPDFRSVRAAAEFLPRVLAALGHARRVVAGSSMGGMLAIQAALARPAAVEAVVIVGGTTRFVSEDRRLGWPVRHVARLRRRLEEESAVEPGGDAAAPPRGAVAAFRQSLFAPGEAAAAADFFCDGSCGAGWERETLLAGLDYLLATDVGAALADLACPVLWIHGAADRICPPQASAAVPPGHQRLVIPEAGHLPGWTRPGETAAAIERFLAIDGTADRRGAP
jgi:pimeloyl-[acyl-carrier protein] methyl ester esterase